MCCVLSLLLPCSQCSHKQIRLYWQYSWDELKGDLASSVLCVWWLQGARDCGFVPWSSTSDLCLWYLKGNHCLWRGTIYTNCIPLCISSLYSLKGLWGSFPSMGNGTWPSVHHHSNSDKCPFIKMAHYTPTPTTMIFFLLFPCSPLFLPSLCICVFIYLYITAMWCFIHLKNSCVQYTLSCQ